MKTDVLPLSTYDGALIAQGTGWMLAWMIAIAEILVCGGMIWYALNENTDYSGTKPKPEETEG